MAPVSLSAQAAQASGNTPASTVRDATANAPLLNEELYDVKADPWQTRNLAADPQFADIKESLKKELTDYLNINLNNYDLTTAKERIRMYLDALKEDGTRITENLDFTVS